MSSMTTRLARSRRLAKTVTVAASDAAVTAAYKRGLKEGTAAAYQRGLVHGANNAHAAAAAAEVIAESRRAAAKDQAEFGIPSGNDECTVGISNPPPPPSRPMMTRAEAMKLVREAMTRTNIVADTVGTDVNGGFGDSWALGQVLVLEALGVLKVSSS